MRRLKTILLTLLMATSLRALAVTNLIIIGHPSSQPAPPLNFRGLNLVPYVPSLVMAVGGLIHLFYPGFIWKLKMFGQRWEFADSAEPSDLWLFFTRLGGIFLIGLSVWLAITVHIGHPLFIK
jgi:hypothetical protein